MDNFALLKKDQDFSAALKEVIDSDAWNKENIRREYDSSPQKQVDDILLRYNDLSDSRALVDVASGLEIITAPVFWKLPSLHPLIFSLFSGCYGERLGRILVTRLPGKAEIPLHTDEGPYAEYYDVRLHCVLQALDVDFVAGTETVQMNTGDVWWFDHTKPHSLKNNADIDRIHLIIDIKSVFGRSNLVSLFKRNCLTNGN